MATTPQSAISSATATLYLGDSVEVMRSLPDESVDLIFADPPYHLSNGGTTIRGGKRTSVDKGAWDRSSGLAADHAFDLAWLTECRRLLTADGSLWVSGTFHNIYSVGYALQELGFRVLNDIAWFKPNAPFNAGCRSFTHSHETLLWSSKSENSRHTFDYPFTREGEFPEDRLKNPGKQMRSVWSIPRVPERERSFGKHPTQKPEALLRRILAATSEVGDTVLDPFCGSGTTGAVAVGMGRRFIGIDSDPAYLHDIAAVRIAASLGTDEDRLELL